MLHKAKSLADFLLELVHRLLRFNMIFEEQTGNPKTLSILDFKSVACFSLGITQHEAPPPSITLITQMYPNVSKVLCTHVPENVPTLKF